MDTSSEQHSIPPPLPPSQPQMAPSTDKISDPRQAPGDNNNYYPQSQQFDTTQQPQAQPYYQKHQPLLDQLGPTSPEFGATPTVEFSNVGGHNNNNNNNNAAGQTDDFSAYDAEPYSTTSLTGSTRAINMRYQHFLDKISPHWKARWAFSLVALFVFMARVVIGQGWYVICYMLAIYYLNLLLGFISPKIDPSLATGDDELGDPMLPTHANDEFRPFIRRLPEFKFWISGTKATLASLFLSMFEVFDVPVFWPILLIYFVILFTCTMRQQIRHMIRYSYVPWDSGKKKYTGRGGNQDSANLYPQTV